MPQAPYPADTVHRHGTCFFERAVAGLREQSERRDHMGMEAGTVALLTLITALITALLSLVNAVGILPVNGKVDLLARRVEWLAGRVDALEGTVQSMIAAIVRGTRGESE